MYDDFISHISLGCTSETVTSNSKWLETTKLDCISGWLQVQWGLIAPALHSGTQTNRAPDIWDPAEQGLLNIANYNIKHPFEFEFQIKNKWLFLVQACSMQYLGVYIYKKAIWCLCNSNLTACPMFCFCLFFWWFFFFLWQHFARSIYREKEKWCDLLKAFKSFTQKWHWHFHFSLIGQRRRD